MRQAKKTLTLSLVLALVTILAAPVRTSAWNPTAHQIVAYIAYKNLTPIARHKVDGLLRQHMNFERWQSRIKMGDSYVQSRPNPATPGNDDFDINVFLLASIWPDEIKGRKEFISDEPSSTPSQPILPSYLMHRGWHFVDLPFTSDGTPLSPPSSPNMLEVLPILSAGVGDTELKDDARAYNLAWLIHLIGDAHQPLHCSTRFSAAQPGRFGDLGGNAFKIMMRGQPTTLHIYWDGLLGTLSVRTFKFSADSISTIYKPKMFINLSEEEDWVKESFDLARTFVYTVSSGEAKSFPVVGSSYDYQARKTAKERVVLAGYRLAAILNEKLQ